MWNEDDFERGMVMEDRVNKISYLMTKERCIGSEGKSIGKIIGYRWNCHHSGIGCEVDLYVASQLLQNKRMIGVYVDVSRALDDPRLYLLAESILIRRLRSLGNLELKNRVRDANVA